MAACTCCRFLTSGVQLHILLHFAIAMRHVPLRCAALGISSIAAASFGQHRLRLLRSYVSLSSKLPFSLPLHGCARAMAVDALRRVATAARSLAARGVAWRCNGSSANRRWRCRRLAIIAGYSAVSNPAQIQTLREANVTRPPRQNLESQRALAKLAAVARLPSDRFRPRYRPDESSFSTFASSQLEYAAIKLIKKSKGTESWPGVLLPHDRSVTAARSSRRSIRFSRRAYLTEIYSFLLSWLLAIAVSRGSARPLALPRHDRAASVLGLGYGESTRRCCEILYYTPALSPGSLSGRSFFSSTAGPSAISVWGAIVFGRPFCSGADRRVSEDVWNWARSGSDLPSSSCSKPQPLRGATSRLTSSRAAVIPVVCG